jgi:hypothetical protein
MNKSDQYLATVVKVLFLAGVFSFVQWARERARAWERWIMQYQDTFSPPPNLGRNGLIQIQTPAEQQIAAASVSLSEALDRIATLK